MRLYHGTNAKFLPKIIKRGIWPRMISARSNWPSFQSRPDMVYLSRAYPMYYAISACGESAPKIAIIEVEIDMLQHERLFPDEDVIAQSVAKEFEVPVSVVHFDARDNLEDYQDKWKESILLMGNCCHQGVIPPFSFTRYATWDFEGWHKAVLLSIDPAISILNYQFRGEWYRKFVAWIFGDEKWLPHCDEVKQLIDVNSAAKESFEFWKEQSLKRDGIKVVALR